MDTERESFLLAIRENFEDDTLKAIFADWLEERGGDPEEIERYRNYPKLREAAKLRITEIADYLGSNDGYYGHQPMNYGVLIDAATEYLDHNDYLVQSGSESWRSDFPSMTEEFWQHYEIITGRTPHDTGSFFSCSC